MATKQRPKAKAPLKSITISRPGKPKVSSLPKMWNKFLVLGDKAILIGNYSQAHKRFKGNNLQGAANCVMACAFAKLNKMEKWSSSTIDTLLEHGTNLHLKSLQYLTNKCTIFIQPNQVYKYFFLGDVKVTMKVDMVDVIVQKLRIDLNPSEVLRDKIMLFFKGHESGIFVCQHKYLAFWTNDKAFFLFDPEEHSVDGGKWEGVPSLGFCYVMRFSTMAAMVTTILSLIHFDVQTKIVLYPCVIEKLVKVNTKPPETIDGKLKTLPKPIKGAKKEKKLPEAKGTHPKASQLSLNLLVEEVSKSKIPLEKVRLKSVTHFCELPDGGILRASNHQNDPEFSRFGGAQSFANAVAALTMLRMAKAKRWVRKTVDTILLLGEVIQEELQFLPPKSMIEKINLDNRIFVPKIEHYAAMGKLRSLKEQVLELLPVLSDFLLENDVTIIIGPLVVAVWIEDDFFYMFDPNERNGAGRSDNSTPGTACVTWFKSSKALVDCYINNVEKVKRRESFYLCKVVIEDYVEISNQWNNFKGIARNKWILRGTFSQNDRRFEKGVSRNTQCTANATMALVFTEMKEEEEWNTETIDEVLIKGDDFYKSCVEELKEKNKFVDPMLMVDELKRNFPLEDKEVKLEIDDCLVNGITNARSETGVPNLRKGFEQFFEDNEAGVVTSHNLSLAVWRRDSTFYYFDSHSRDEKGVCCSYGTACVLRLMTVEELARCVQTNYGPNSQHAYNISRIGVKLLEITEDGIVLPPLNHYEEIRDLVAILRSSTSTNGPEFDLNRGKQAVPMCLVALGMNTITEALFWSREDLDEIFKIGNTLYSDSMEANLTNEELPEDQDVDEITSNNVKNQHMIGLNQITTEFEQFAEGNIETNLEEAITSLFASEPPTVGIFESSLMTTALWNDENLFYLFDPKPRDENGEIFGKDVWSTKPVEVEEEETPTEVEQVKPEIDQLGGGDNLGHGSQDLEEEPVDLNVARIEVDTEDDETENEETVEEEEEEEEEKEPVVEVKYSEIFQNAQANLDGKGCVLRFSRVEDVVKHLVENSPPNKREEIQFTLKKVKVDSNPVVKEIQDPESEKPDEIAGDWFNFKEMDYGKWILRGTKNLDNVLFPVENRNKQKIPTCFAVFAFVRFYTLTKFKSTTIDSILSYGDRLYTSTKRRKQELLRQNKELGLTEEEILAITSDQVYTLEDYPRKICIAEHLAVIELEVESIIGDIKAKNMEEILDIERGLKKLFDTRRFAILESKGLTVAVWRLAMMFYMFDPNPRGPNGGKSPIGVPCMTRFTKLDDLVGVFLKNLPRDGDNSFVVHGVSLQQSECPRERQPEIKAEEPPIKLGGFRPIVPGKSILRGTLKQDYTKFNRGCHVQGAPVAFVALSMSLVQKPETWTQAVIDEILRLGDELYGDTVKGLGMKFNAWVDQIDVHRVKNDFKIGSLKANCELRFMDQKGLVDIKNSPIPNLRQGIENFFMENTHGILIVDNLILPLWEEEKDDEISIYMYDPNARGPSGLPMPGGTACSIKFCNAKIASDHVLAMIPGDDKSQVPFVITPVEIVVGTSRTKRKPRKMTKKQSSAVVAPPIAKCQEMKIATEQQKKLRAIAEEERRLKECKRIAALGRNEFYKLSEIESILRGLRCMSQNRDISTNYVAFVLMKVSSIDKWNYKQLEVIMETGNQLYIDSSVAYNPKNKQLGLMGILRKFYVKNLQVQLTVFKPIKIEGFTSIRLVDVIERYFQQENFTIINYKEKYVSVHLKSGFYYYFDPYSRDLQGNKTTKGCCMVMKFSNVQTMAKKIIDNIGDDNQEVEPFYLITLSIKEMIKGK